MNRMNWNDQLLLWHEATVKLLDIRHVALGKNEELRGYLLPSSSFIWVTRGQALVTLDGESYAAQRFHLLHGGKGMCLNIVPSADVIEYDLIFYKGHLAGQGNRKLQQLMEHSNPFQIQYGFAPQNPLALHKIVRKMEESWGKLSMLDKLGSKGLLYQFVHELMGQLTAQEIAAIRPDLVWQAIRYIEDNYPEPITVEGLAGLLGCSASYLSRLFKKQLATTPNDYLIKVRMDHAKQLLSDTQATLQEIAASTGYLDVYYFSRVFKKHTGLPPLRFRSRAASGKLVQNNPLHRSGQAIVPHPTHSYNYNDNSYQSVGEGDLTMHKELKLSVAAVMLLCMALLFSGCSGSAAVNDRSITAEASATGENSAVQQALQTKVVQHVMGETEIPVNPQRIAASGLEDILLALDAPIVQAQAMKGQYLYETLQEKNIPAIYTPDSLNYEAILDAKPDLIMAHLLPTDKESYEKLSKIAPTIVYDRGDWKTSMAAIGKAIDREEQAQAVIDAYNEKLEQTKEAVAEAVGANNSVAFIRPSQSDVQVFFPAFAYTSLVYKDVGLATDASVVELEQKEEEGIWGVGESLEKLPEITADHLFVTVGGSFDSEEEAQTALTELDEIEQMKVWQEIPAVKKGNVHKVSARHWMLNGPTADSMKLDDVLQALVKS